MKNENKSKDDVGRVKYMERADQIICLGYTSTQQCDADGGEIRFITTEECYRNRNHDLCLENLDCY